MVGAAAAMGKLDTRTATQTDVERMGLTPPRILRVPVHHNACVARGTVLAAGPCGRGGASAAGEFGPRGQEAGECVVRIAARESRNASSPARIQNTSTSVNPACSVVSQIY